MDDEIRDLALKFIDKAKKDGKPFFCLAQPDAHAHRHASLGEVREDAQLGEWLVGSRKPAWPNSMTTSAWS